MERKKEPVTGKLQWWGSYIDNCTTLTRRCLNWTHVVPTSLSPYSRDWRSQNRIYMQTGSRMLVRGGVQGERGGVHGERGVVQRERWGVQRERLGVQRGEGGPEREGSGPEREGRGPEREVRGPERGEGSRERGEGSMEGSRERRERVQRGVRGPGPKKVQPAVCNSSQF